MGDGRNSDYYVLCIMVSVIHCTRPFGLCWTGLDWTGPRERAAEDQIAEEGEDLDYL